MANKMELAPKKWSLLQRISTSSNQIEQFLNKWRNLQSNGTSFNSAENDQPLQKLKMEIPLIIMQKRHFES